MQFVIRMIGVFVLTFVISACSEEQKISEPEAPTFEIVEVESYPILSIESTIADNPESMSKAIGDAYAELMGFVTTHQLEVPRPPLVIYVFFDKTTTTIKAAFPIAQKDIARVPDHEVIKLDKTYGGKALKTTHKGAYSGLRETYSAINAHMVGNELVMAAPNWEVYLTDPNSVPEDELLTEIYFPLR